MKKTIADTPRIDLVGEEALQKATGLFGKKIKNPDMLYNATISGDIVGNATYYSMIENGNVWKKAVSVGSKRGSVPCLSPAFHFIRK